jgi:nickel superoxide dismutase
MKTLFLTIGIAGSLYLTPSLNAHCQMPCGIYHDDMVYDQIDQYTETMYKGVAVMLDSKFESAKERNEFVRWTMQKESASDEAASILTKYFLQQKIKPGESDTAKRIESVHKLLFLLVAIKQNVDLTFVKEFTEEWEKFKLMFHREGYECQIEQLKLKDAAKKEEAAREKDHEHGPDTHTH